jgi:hypothetical protein
MNPKKLTNFSIGLWSLVLLLGFASCNQFEAPDAISELSDEISASNEAGSINAKMSLANVTPILWTGGNGGNATCADAGSYERTSGRNNYEGGVFSMEWPEGLTVNVSSDGKYVSWSYDAPEGYCLESMAVIVKGGPAAHIYKYEAGTTWDEGLHSPLTGGKKKTIAALSNLTFCFNLTEAPEAPEATSQSECFGEGAGEFTSLTATATAPEGATIVWYDAPTGGNIINPPTLSGIGSVTYYAEAVLFSGCVSETRTPVMLTLEDCGDDGGSGDDDECKYKGETAYGGGTAGSGAAWWYYFDTQGPASQPIYAGQKLTGGTISYNSGTDVITINLNELQLQSVSEPVKVQGYNTLPSTRPASGLFTLYKGSNLTIQGNGSRYYVIHLDAKVPYDCPL